MLQPEVLNDVHNFVLGHLEQLRHLLVGHGPGMVSLERKIDPLTQREIKVQHDMRTHTFRSQLLVRDLHLRQLLRRPPHAPHLGKVRVQVRERVHGEARHVREVCQLQGAAVHPLLRRRLDRHEIPRRQPDLLAQPPPRVALGRDVLPDQHAPRLVPQTVEPNRLQGRDFHAFIFFLTNRLLSAFENLSVAEYEFIILYMIF